MQKKTRKKRKEKAMKEKRRRSTNLDDVIDVDLAILVVVQRLSNAQQFVLWDVLDLPHDGDELIDADQVLPEGVEQTAYRKRLCDSCFDGDEEMRRRRSRRRTRRKKDKACRAARGNSFWRLNRCSDYTKKQFLY